MFFLSSKFSNSSSELNSIHRSCVRQANDHLEESHGRVFARGSHTEGQAEVRLRRHHL